MLTLLLARARAVTEPLSVRPLRALWQAQVVSEVGDWAARLALALLVFDRTGSALATAAVTTVGLLPWFGVGQLLATAADRYDHRAVMLVANLARAALFAALALADLPLAGVLVLAFLAGCGDPPFEAAVSGALPQVAGERYLATMTLLNATKQVATLVGFAAGGVLVAATSTTAALLVNAASFVVASALLVHLPRTTSTPEGGDDRLGAWALLTHGSRALVGDRMVLAAASVVTLTAFGGIATEALLVPYAGHLGLTERGAGLLATVMPAAAVSVAFALPSQGSARRLVLFVCWSTGLLSLLSGALFALDVPLVLAVVALAMSGALQLVTVPAGSVIGTRLPVRSRGTAFSILQGALQAAQALGALVAGAVAGASDVPTSLAVMSLPGVGAGLLGLWLLRRTPYHREAGPAGRATAGRATAGRDGARAAAPRRRADRRLVGD